MKNQSTKTYRVSFILDSRNLSEPTETVLEKLKTLITDLKGVIEESRILGQKSFAYVRQQNFREAPYAQIKFSGDASILGVLREKAQMDQSLYRLFIERV